jgi:hypothetical protein
MGQAGRCAALGRFGWAGEAARLVAFYRALAPLAGVPRDGSPPVPLLDHPSASPV